MRPAHPLAQPGRLATLDTLAGTAARNEAEEGREEIYEEKKESDFESSEAFDEEKGGGVQLRAGAQVNSDPAKRKNKRIVQQHSRKEKKDERKQLVKSAKMPGLGCGVVKPIQAMSGF